MLMLQIALDICVVNGPERFKGVGDAGGGKSIGQSGSIDATFSEKVMGASVVVGRTRGSWMMVVAMGEELAALRFDLIQSESDGWQLGARQVIGQGARLMEQL